MGQFTREDEMTAPATRWLENQGFHVKREFMVPWGVCDLVGVLFNKRNEYLRLGSGQTRPIGPIQRVALLQRIPDVNDDKWITLPTLQREFREVFSPKQTEEELEKLRSMKFVQSPRKNAYQKVNGWIPLNRRLVAVELKMHRVGEALSQAVQHLRFASETYVGLPAECARRIQSDQRGDRFRQLGVGLLAVSRLTCKTLIRPRNSDEVDPVLEIHAVERFWRST